MKKAIISILTAVIFVLSNIHVLTVGYYDSTDMHGTIYGSFAIGYSNSEFITPEGNIWGYNADILPNTTYYIIFCDMGTTDITDDVIMDFWSIEK